MTEKVNADVAEVAWDDNSLKLTELTFFKGLKDQSQRIFILTERPQLMRIHYHDGYFKCLSTYGKDSDGEIERTEEADCCKSKGAPQLRFGVVVCVFDTKRDGSLKEIYKKNPADLGYELSIWLFGEKTFKNLKTKNSEWNLKEHDLLVTCTNEKYQHLEIELMKATWTTQNTKLGTKIKRDFDLFRFKDVSPYLGKNLSEGEIAVRLGSTIEQDPELNKGKVNNEDFDTLLDELNNDQSKTDEKQAKTESKKKEKTETLTD